MANLGRQNQSVVVLLPDKRVWTITIYILYKYTRPVKHYEIHRLYEQQTQTVFI